MRYVQSLLLMLLLCLPSAMPAMAAEGDAEAVVIATRLLDHMQAGEYEAATAAFTAQSKNALGVDQLTAVQAPLAPACEDTGRADTPGHAQTAMQVGGTTS